ncbi:MAG: YIP1 family protein [Anaerolineae bacterium]|nr:YIP1 family protein [Anaerolineae bacterium]
MSDVLVVTTEPQPDEYAEQQPEKPAVVSLLAGIVIHPQATFKNLREMEKGYWWLVFLITIAAVILYTVVSTGVSANTMSRAMQNLPEGVAADNAGANMPQVTQSSSLLTVVVPLLSGIIMILLGYAFRGLIAFGGSMVMGGNATFKQTFRMAVWSTIPAIFRNIVRSIAVVASQGRIIEGLTGVMTTLEARTLPVLNLLLGQVDFYAVWSMVLLGIGIAVTTRLGKNKSIVAVLVYIVIAIGGLLLYYVISNAIGGLAGSQQSPGMMRGPRG